MAPTTVPPPLKRDHEPRLSQAADPALEYTRPGPAKYATDEELDRCRRDYSLADKLYPGFVICLECGARARRLVRSPKCHARRKHPDIDYRATWPGAPLLGVGIAEADLKQHKDYVKGNRGVVNEGRRRAYSKKLKAREANPDGPEAAFINLERDRAAKINYENYWGAPTPEGVKELRAAAKVDPTGPAAKKLADAAAFRESEKKRKKARNPRSAQRARELVEERAAAAKANPDGPEAKLLEAKRKKGANEQGELRRRAHRPKCWGDLEPDKQALWLIMKEHPEAKGGALGALLDEASIECTFGERHWADVLGHKKAKGYSAAKMHISRILNLK